jgi:hypothetical protein
MSESDPRNMRGFDAAQREYDNRTPPDDGPYECPDCNGNGHAPVPGYPDGDNAKCSACSGYGLIDENGEPFDPHQAEREACEYADMQRDYERDHPDRWADSQYDDVY